jgi:hypothetical protein
LNNQLETYIFNIRSGEVFITLKGIEQLVEKMIVMKKKNVYQLVYSLVTLVLIMLVTTTNVEKSFFRINIIVTN